MSSNKKDSKELLALVRLLDDPNETVYSKVKEQIFLYGSEAIPALENAWENSFDDTIQQRSLNLIHEIQFENTYLDLNKWAHFQFDDLLLGYIIVTKYNYPDLDSTKIIAQTAKIIQDVWLELNNNLTGLEKIKVINHVFFDLFHFRNNKKNFYAAENFFLNNLLETKLGNPISLGLLYLIVCRSLKIPVYGVNLPNHFVLAYVDEISILHSVVEKDDVLFYLNPFNKGKVFTKNEIDLFVRQLKLEPNDNYYLPCDNTTIIHRLLEDMILAYTKLGYNDKIAELKRLLEAVQI